MTTLKLTLIVLPIVEIAIFIWLLIRKDRKQKKPVARYEDYEAIFYDP
jgi:preprotein translocase subunit YajC